MNSNLIIQNTFLVALFLLSQKCYSFSLPQKPSIKSHHLVKGGNRGHWLLIQSAPPPSRLGQYHYQPFKTQTVSMMSANADNNNNNNDDNASDNENQSSTLQQKQEGQISRIRKKLSSFTSRLRRRSPKKVETELEPPEMEMKLNMLRQENDLLRKTITQLELENSKLQKMDSQRRKNIIIENFEGEGNQLTDDKWFLEGSSSNAATSAGKNGTDIALSADTTASLTMMGDEMYSTSNTMMWCDELSDDELDEGTCPIEPDVSFMDALRDRAYWLVGLLALQSCSGIILSRNEELLQTHPVIVYFLTMLVGAGGNAGNQASVRVIRGLALGTLNERTQNQFLQRELKMSLALSSVLSMAGFLRAAAFRTPFAETIAITSALCMIVFSSVCLGAVLPLFLKRLGVDPAHSSTTIQVIMDILGVVLTVFVSTTILDSPFGQMIISKLSFGS
mmetsp:Transcript_26068/g.36763  ORF Transcript_26068/g.36763 Transcript_26068/m.36763 type:complete len:449 (-) Transcript_26068:429-1775(-)